MDQQMKNRMQYNVGKLPIHASILGRRQLPATDTVSHFHEEYEIIIMRTGSMQYQVGTDVFSLNEGQVLFVNSGRMHKCIPLDGEECNYAYLAIAPELLFSNPVYAETKEKLSGEGAADFLLLSPGSPRQMKMTAKAEDAFKYLLRKREGFEFSLTGSLYEFFGFLLAYMQEESPKEEVKDSKKSALYAMVGYIQNHYQEKITLETLAAAGDICRSRCCEYFKEFFKTSPNAYITEYRLAKAKELLETTELGAKEIGKMCGFAGASYFTEAFHKVLHMTPMDYRKQKRKK